MQIWFVEMESICGVKWNELMEWEQIKSNEAWPAAAHSIPFIPLFFSLEWEEK